ncbi:MAG TPA: hypothetical protein VF465_07340, partial [Flavobacterium sp.]|uniref:hypothetical protein n=1 Tax=Flavobacterium sp. TaxID=239 RepID=UPI002ECFF71D
IPIASANVKKRTAINLVENKKENIFLSIFEGITVYKSGTKVLKNVDLKYLSFVNKNQKESICTESNLN